MIKPVGVGASRPGRSQLFLSRIQERPVYARVEALNTASLRVLEKCGFIRIGTNRDFANARGKEIEEVLLKLN